MSVINSFENWDLMCPLSTHKNKIILSIPLQNMKHYFQNKFFISLF
jgi:hypothetical protein